MGDSAHTWAQRVLSHSFDNQALLREAVTHPSLAGGPSYQRLEFLGDRVLGLAVAQRLLESYPEESEGTIARRFVKLVRKETLAAIARDIGVPDIIQLESAARQAGIHKQDGVCADVLEALLGALYLDAGLGAVTQFISAYWGDLMAAEAGATRDPKTRLQEWAQGRGLPLPHYEVVSQDGPDHAPTFTIRVTVESSAPVEASGNSKRLAEKAAADALWITLQKGST